MKPQALNHRYFKPWVGTDYDKKSKVLILGESIYRCPHTSPERCVELITNNCTGTERHKFYTNIYLSFAGPDAPRTPEAKSTFWNSVSYINYVDDLVESSRRSPSPESFEQAKQEWQQLLDYFKPDYIIALGARLWRNLPAPEANEKLCVEGFEQHPLFIYRHAEGSAKMTYVNHPSTGYSSAKWHQVVSGLLQS